MRNLFLAGTAGLGLLALSASADAGVVGQISLGTGTGTMTFAGNGPGTTTLSYSQSILTGSATDTTSATEGSYTITAITPKTVTETIPGVLGTWNFPSGTTATLTYTNGADSLTDVLTFSELGDGTPNPHVSGTDTITQASGTAAFLATFGVGTSTNFDYSSQGVTTLLDLLAGTTGSESVAFSAGEVDALSKAPEPATLAVLGVGLLGLGLTRVRRRRH